MGADKAPTIRRSYSDGATETTAEVTVDARNGACHLGRVGHTRPMAKISAPKLFENPVMKPAAKKLARRRLIDQAISIGRAQKAMKVAKKYRRQAPENP